jgi:hypothetical protein
MAFLALLDSETIGASLGSLFGRLLLLFGLLLSLDVVGSLEWLVIFSLHTEL